MSRRSLLRVYGGDIYTSMKNTAYKTVKLLLSVS